MKTKQLVFAAVFAALIAVGAQIRVPSGPVPFTLQVPMVLLCGMMLGKKYGLISVIVYIAVGLIGVPVFAGSGGLGSLISPSFGFVLGFIPAVVVTAMGGKEYLSKMILFSILGMIVIFIVGVMYFSFIINYFVCMTMGLLEILVISLVTFVNKG